MSHPGLQGRLSQRVLPLAIGWLWLAFGWHALTSSIVIGGQRHFILSDDALISMRYADNLTRGLGLVWNPGERVEGYSNLLWTLWMAVLHLLPLSKARIPLLLGLSSCALASWAMVSLRNTTRRLLEPDGRLQTGYAAMVENAPVVLLATSMSFLSWTFAGLELALLVALAAKSLGLYVEWSRESEPRSLRRIAWRIAGIFSVGVLVRDDFVTVCAATFMALALATVRRNGTSREYASLVLVVVLPLVVKSGHLAFRYEYYHALVPNTYVQKVAGWPLPERMQAGAEYVIGSARRLAVFLVPLILYCWKRRGGSGPFAPADAVSAYAAIMMTVLGAYAAYVGGDAFRGDRLFLTGYPVLLCAAVLASHGICRGRRHSTASLGVLVACLFLFAGDHLVEWRRGIRVHDQSNAAWNIVVAQYLVTDYPRAKVGVFWAGGVPYYSRLEAVDLLGLNDRTIAAAPLRGTKRIPGHGKFDYEYVFDKQRPDFIVGPFERYDIGGYRRSPAEFISQMARQAEESDYPFAPALFASREFLDCYYPNRVRIPASYFPQSREISMPTLYRRCANPGRSSDAAPPG